MEQPSRQPRALARDAGLARLKHTTRVTVVGATALAGGVAALAAHSFPGHKANAAVVRSTAGATHSATRVRHRASPTQSDDQSQSESQPAAPSQTQPAAPAPVQTTAPPVATSGNS